MPASKWLFLSGLALSATAVAQSDGTAPPPSPTASPCVDVEVNGYRALSYECLSAQIAPSPQRPVDNPALASKGTLSLPGNQLGLFNRSATSNRMGNTLGTSAYPQRPPRP